MGKSDYMDSALHKCLLVFSVLILSGVVISPLNLTNALTDFASDLPSAYSNVCIVCHTNESGGEGLNSFGTDYLENDNDLEAINNLDSDSDGYTNEEELDAGTFPGDPESKPMSIDGWTNIAVAVGLVLVFVVINFKAK